MNVTGTWKGEYTFEEVEGGGGKAMEGHVVAFTMQLKQSWLGMISGTVQDDPRSGFQEAGTIKGRLKKNVFGFRKHMPVLRLIHESSRMTLEHWADRHKVVVDTLRPNPPILHMGDVSEDGRTMEGRWRMAGVTIEIPGSQAELQIPTLGGSWKMMREG